MPNQLTVSVHMSEILSMSFYGPLCGLEKRMLDIHLPPQNLSALRAHNFWKCILCPWRCLPQERERDRDLDLISEWSHRTVVCEESAESASNCIEYAQKRSFSTSKIVPRMYTHRSCANCNPPSSGLCRILLIVFFDFLPGFLTCKYALNGNVTILERHAFKKWYIIHLCNA